MKNTVEKMIEAYHKDFVFSEVQAPSDTKVLFRVVKEIENTISLCKPGDFEAFLLKWGTLIEEDTKKETIEKGVARIATEIMSVSLFKDQDDFERGHIHGLRRAMISLISEGEKE